MNRAALAGALLLAGCNNFDPAAMCGDPANLNLVRDAIGNGVWTGAPAVTDFEQTGRRFAKHIEFTDVAAVGADPVARRANCAAVLVLTDLHPIASQVILKAAPASAGPDMARIQWAVLVNARTGRPLVTLVDPDAWSEVAVMGAVTMSPDWAKGMGFYPEAERSN